MVGVIAPVVRIDFVSDSDVAHLLGYLQGPNLVGGVGFLIDRIRRTEESGLNANESCVETLGQIQLYPHVTSGDVADVGMGEGMIPDLVAFLVNTFDQAWTLLSL